MREFINLFEGKWWERTPTITLYHGTSSALEPLIRYHGLCPPSQELRAYALDVLREYVPEDQWDDELLRHINDHAIRAHGGRAGDRGPVLYCFTDAGAVEGYAKSYAKHGGEIAHDVYESVCSWLGDPNETLRQRISRPRPITPRFEDGEPIVVEIEVPREWCLFDVDPEAVLKGATTAWNKGIDWATDDCDSLEDLLDEVFDRREVRVDRTVRPEMIKSIRRL